MTSRHLLSWGVGAILISAPIPFGCVEDLPAAILTLIVLCTGAVWVLSPARSGASEGLRNPVAVVGFVVLAVAAWQLTPIPVSMLRVLSPEAAELRTANEPAVESFTSNSNPDAVSDGLNSEPLPDVPPGLRPLSLYPWATWRAALWATACLVLTMVVADLAASATTRRMLFGAIVASGASQALYGLAEYVSGRQQIFGYVKRHYTEMATGTFINRNHYAGYLEMTLPLAIAALAAVLQGIGVGRNGPARTGLGGLGRRLAASSGRELFAASALFLAALTMATAIVCSQSRMGIAGAVVALGVIALVQFRRGRGLGFALSAFAVAFVALVLLVRADATSPVLRRFSDLPAQLDVGLGRWSIWSQAAELVRRFPLTGVGLGAFGAVMPVYRTEGPGFALEHAHNDYLELAGEAGLLGCAAILVAAVVAVWRWRRGPLRPEYGLVGYGAAAGLVAMAFHSLADFNLRIPANALTAAALLGIVLARRSSPDPAKTLPRLVAPAGVPGPNAAGASPRARAPRIATAAFLAGLAVLSLAPPAALRRRDPEFHFNAAAALARETMGDLRTLIDSGNGEGAAADYLVTRMRQAVEAQERGIRLAPTLAPPHLSLAELKSGLCAAELLGGERADAAGCAAEILPEIRTGLSLAPLSATLHLRAARMILAARMDADPSTADVWQPILRRALQLNPADKEIRTAVGRLGGDPATGLLTTLPPR
jgi:O-antigen ligase